MKLLNLLTILAVLLAPPIKAQRLMENLDRGLVAIPQGEGKVYVGWRLLGTEPNAIAFNLYRTTGKGKPLKLNKKPITQSTNFVDQGIDAGQANQYTVRAVLKGKEQAASKPYTIAANAPIQPYITLPLQAPAGYAPNDVSAADLDGDGAYDPGRAPTSRGRDNSQKGLTDAPVLEGYKLDGTLL